MDLVPKSETNQSKSIAFDKVSHYLINQIAFLHNNRRYFDHTDKEKIRDLFNWYLNQSDSTDTSINHQQINLDYLQIRVRTLEKMEETLFQKVGPKKKGIKVDPLNELFLLKIKRLKLSEKLFSKQQKQSLFTFEQWWKSIAPDKDLELDAKCIDPNVFEEVWNGLNYLEKKAQLTELPDPPKVYFLTNNLITHRPLID